MCVWRLNKNNLQNDGSELPPELQQIADTKEANPNNLMAKHFSEEYFFSLSQDKRTRLLHCCRPGYVPLNKSRSRSMVQLPEGSGTQPGLAWRN